MLQCEYYVSPSWAKPFCKFKLWIVEFQPVPVYRCCEIILPQSCDSCSDECETNDHQLDKIALFPIFQCNNLCNNIIGCLRIFFRTL